MKQEYLHRLRPSESFLPQSSSALARSIPLRTELALDKGHRPIVYLNSLRLRQVYGLQELDGPAAKPDRRLNFRAPQWHTNAGLGRHIQVDADMTKSRRLGFLDYEPANVRFARTGRIKRGPCIRWVLQ